LPGGVEIAEASAGGIKISYEFRADGTGEMDAIFKLNFRYRQSGNKLTIEPLDVGFGGLGGKVQGGESHLTVRREGDTLILRDDSKGGDMRLSKVR
jgi:hypothetical protein